MQNWTLNFWSLVQFYCSFLLCAKYLFQDCLNKQIFGGNLARSLSHLNIWTFSVTSKHFSNHDKNINQVGSFKSSRSNGFVLALFCILGLGQNLTLQDFPLCRLVFFEQTNIFESKLVLFPESWIIIESVESKRKCSDNPGHNILALFNNLAQVWITASKTILDI